MRDKTAELPRVIEKRLGSWIAVQMPHMPDEKNMIASLDLLDHVGNDHGCDVA